MRIALLQIDLNHRGRADNLQRLLVAVRRAAASTPAPDVVVLPGACDVGGGSPRGTSPAFLDAVRESVAWFAREWGIYLVAGLHPTWTNDLEPETVIIDPDGDVVATTGARPSLAGTPPDHTGPDPDAGWKKDLTGTTEISAGGIGSRVVDSAYGSHFRDWMTPVGAIGVLDPERFADDSRWPDGDESCRFVLPIPVGPRSRKHRGWASVRSAVQNTSVPIPGRAVVVLVPAQGSGGSPLLGWRSCVRLGDRLIFEADDLSSEIMYQVDLDAGGLEFEEKLK